MKCGICGKDVRDLIEHFRKVHKLLKGRISEESAEYLREIGVSEERVNGALKNKKNA